MAIKIIIPARRNQEVLPAPRIAATSIAIAPVSDTSVVTTSARTGGSGVEVRIRKRFANPEGSFILNVSFRARPGFTVLFGASGAGKTTVLDCVAGLGSPDDGRIVIGDECVYDAEKKKNMAAWKRRIGYVQQDLALFPHLTALQNIAYGLGKLPAPEREARGLAMLDRFRVAHARDRRPEEISGGERQRVALARALVTEPRVLLLDEPLAALDRPTRSALIDDLRQWNRDHRAPILFVTHSSEEVFALGDEVIVLDAGKIVAQGQPHKVMRAPGMETIASLSGFENIFDAEVMGSRGDRGTMTCRLDASAVELETPLVAAELGSRLKIGIRAGDLLLATETPVGLSARNILPGKIVGLERRDVIAAARVECSGAQFEVHVTLAARDDLQLEMGKHVWVVVKTHSCHSMRA